MGGAEIESAADLVPRRPLDAVEKLMRFDRHRPRELDHGVDPRDSLTVLKHPDLGAVEGGPLS